MLHSARGFVSLMGIICLVTACDHPISTPVQEPVPDVPALKSRADAGDAEAQRRLGALYAKGLGVEQDYQEAASWYRRAAEQGNAAAQTALGELCEAGQGVPRDETNAAQWYLKAAEQGYALGQYNLAVLYTVGSGVLPDTKEALKWYRAAAHQGDALAQYNLGMRYYEGNGVAPDPTEAYLWLSLAAAHQMTDAENALAQLTRSMKPDELAEGRTRVAAFTPIETATPAAR